MQGMTTRRGGEEPKKEKNVYSLVDGEEEWGLEEHEALTHGIQVPVLKAIQIIIIIIIVIIIKTNGEQTRRGGGCVHSEREEIVYKESVR
jgi:hypothetical protein